MSRTSGILAPIQQAITTSLIFARGYGVGHNIPQEAPQAFAQAVVDVDHL